MQKFKFALFAVLFGLTVMSCKANSAKAEAATDSQAAVVEQPQAAAEQPQVATQPAESALTLPTSDEEFRPGMKVSVPTVVDFNATWCGPCRYLAPSFDKAAEAYKGKVRFVSIDVDKYRQTANAYGIQSIPTLMIMLPDGTVSKYVGLNDFLVGLDMNSNMEPSAEELNAIIYGNLTKIVDSKLKK